MIVAAQGIRRPEPMGPQSFSEYAWDQIVEIMFWLIQNQVSIWLVLISILLLSLGYLKLRRAHHTINRLWNLTLFFLTKRLMLLPIIYRIAQIEGVLDNEKCQKMLQIRSECRHTSLRNNPTQRLQKESELSRILYDFFSELDDRGEITKHPKLQKLVQDLEFIDAKLVELQNLYNQHAKKWNQNIRWSWLEKPMQWLRIGRFRLFT